MKQLLKCFQICLWIVFAVSLYTNAYAKTLRIEIELPISDENEALIPIVARDNQWRPDSLYDSSEGISQPVSAPTYIAELMLTPFLRQYLKDKILIAHKNYYGEYRLEERVGLAQLLDSRLSITAGFDD